MRKTLLITDDFYPRVGGVAAYYHEICRRLPPDKINVLTVPLAAGTSASTTYPVERQRLLSENPLVWPKWIAALSVVRKLKARRAFERLWVGQILPYGIIGWLIRRRWHVPYVVTVHGMDLSIPRGRRRHWCGMILRSAERVVANSNATKKLVAEYGVDPRRVSVITPGVSHPNATATQVITHVRERHGLVGKKIVLSVGRLVARKGHANVLRVLPELVRNIPNLRYVVVGDGPQRKQLQALTSQLRLQEYVQFVGAVDAAVLSVWYEISDVFVLTPEPDSGDGDIEGFGMVYLEASAHAKPVIATNIPGVDEAVADRVSGLLVAPGNHQQLANALRRILEDPQFGHRLGAQGQDRAFHKFDWQPRADAYTSIFS